MLRKLSSKNDKNEEFHFDNGSNFIHDILDKNKNNDIINNNFVKENKNIIKLKKIKDNKKEEEYKDKSDKFRDVINIKSLTNAEQDPQYNKSTC